MTDEEKRTAAEWAAFEAAAAPAPPRLTHDEWVAERDRHAAHAARQETIESEYRAACHAADDARQAVVAEAQRMTDDAEAAYDYAVRTADDARQAARQEAAAQLAGP